MNGAMIGDIVLGILCTVIFVFQVVNLHAAREHTKLHQEQPLIKGIKLEVVDHPIEEPADPDSNPIAWL